MPDDFNPNIHDREYWDDREYWGDEDQDDYDPGEDCGRWINGRLGKLYNCRLAGTEFCDFECPHRS